MEKNNSFFSIEKYGSQVLRTPSSVIEKFDRELEKIANKMLKTMYHEDGVGLAAPQVGINKRVIVIDVDYASSRYEETVGNKEAEADFNPIVMVNPVIVYREGEMDSYEGCLSFPGVFFKVKRAQKIVFKFQDLKGKEIRMEAAGDLFCRCVQHEIDHLNGKLFVDIAIDKAEAQTALTEHGLGEVKSPPPLFMT
jgi:peptide deformylase